MQPILTISVALTGAVISVLLATLAVRWADRRERPALLAADLVSPCIFLFRGGRLADLPNAPVIRRDPGLIHGLRNIIQNAVDFAESRVTIDADWTADHLIVVVEDDGPGFPAPTLGQLADPFPVSRRNDHRPGYEGMGLGLFIARALLEGTGARLRFDNGDAGAKVTIRWPIARIRADDRTALRQNPQIS